MSAEHQTIERCGDTELWVVDGANWDLPVLADPYGIDGKPTHWRLRPPLDAAITIEMLKALDSRLNPFKVAASGSHVIVTYENLQRFAKKAPGITPGFYLHWRTGGDPEPEGEVEREQLIPDPPESDKGKDFCAYLHRLTGVVDFPTLRLIWKAIMQYGPKWLIEQRKPIDFGFVKLVPVPYRPNWKSLLLARYPLSPAGFRKPKAERNKWIEEGGLLAEFFNTMLAAYDHHGKSCHWTLEAVTGSEWIGKTARYENGKAGTLGPSRYAEFWRRGIKKMLPHLLEAFAEWCDWGRMPCAQLDEGVLFGSRRLIAWVPQGRILPAPPSAGPQLVVVDSDLTQLKGPPETKKIRSPAGDMLELSDILPEPRHLRLLPSKTGEPEGSPLPEPENQRNGADGLPVLYGSEGQNPGGNLLAEGSGLDNGVAGQS